MAEIEGKDDSKDKLGDAFITLLVNIEEDKVAEEYSDSYFTLVEHLLTEPTIAHAGSPHAKVLIKELNNQALIHRLIAQVPINTTKLEEIEETTTFTTRSMSRYNLHYFYRVVIDTGASKYSTAGYGQFQALQRTNGITLNENTKG